MAATDRLERLINLVIALRETRVPLTAAQIRERVAGYGQPDAEAFRRMFERDKSDLRSLGVPVETAAIDAWGDRQGYRIDPARYDLPELALAPDELAALAVAVEATGLSDEAVGGLRKLEVDLGAPGLSAQASAPRMGVAFAAPHRTVLVEAQMARAVVRFAYRAADGTAAERTVDPHGVVHRGGRWYLVGRDHDRDARRAFRLDRIVSEPRTVTEEGAFPVPAEVSVADVLPEHPDAPGTATVDASPDIAWQVARRARGGGEELPDGWVRFRVPIGHPETFLGWALEHGPLLVVREPAEQRERVIAALRDLASSR